MPKTFDKSKLGFSAGAKSSTESKNVSYIVKGNEIKGKYNGTLNPGEALTVRLDLPEGYFVGASDNSPSAYPMLSQIASIYVIDIVGYKLDFLMLVALFLPLIFFGIFFLQLMKLWMKYAEKNKVKEKVEFYPPKELNSAEVGLYYKGRADNNDIVSLLIYLANKGYLKISETTEKSFFLKKEGFKISKIKDYDGNNENERIFLEGLFENKNEVTAADLYNNFYLTLGLIKVNLNSKENKEKIFEKETLGKGGWGFLAIIIIFLLITIRPVLENDGELGGFFGLLFALSFPGVGLLLTVGFLIWGEQKSGILFGVIFGTFFGGMPWCFLVLPALFDKPIYWKTYIVGFVCIIGIVILIKLFPMRTKYGNEILAQIKGFKKFLEAGEKQRLETSIRTDPKYFYNILPYIYVLDISKKWIKKFEAIGKKQPDWYDSNNAFNTATFGAVIASTMSSALYAMSSSPSSDSSGSGSGGGSSGGGSGGGGGGSW
jgi:hypothetical protein